MQLSDEQQEFVRKALLLESNLTLQATPGSGKTTTLIEIQKQIQNSVALTYSAKLKTEWRQRCSANIHSFHSFGLFCSNFCNYKKKLHSIFDDKALRKLLKQVPVRPLPQYDVCLIDETQDMNALHFALLKWYHEHSGANMFFVLVGQAQQCVYDYKPGDEKADLDFLLKPHEKFASITNREWQNHRLTKSFRLSSNTAEFVNRFFHLPQVSCINGMNAEGNPVHYHCIDLFKYSKVAHIIMQYIKEYGSGNIQIISAVREKAYDKSNTTKILNNLATKGILIRTCENNAYEMHTQAEQLQRYTLPSSKGTEADCTIIIGSDSFFDFTTDAQQFVAATRPKKQLVLMQHCHNMPWQGWKSPDHMKTIGSCVTVKMSDHYQLKASALQPRMCFVSNLLDVQDDVELNFNNENDPAYPITYKHIIQFQTASNTMYAENVSNAYGTAISLFTEFKITKKVPDSYRRIFDPVIVSQTDFYGSLAKQVSPKVAKILKKLEKTRLKTKTSEKAAIATVKSTLLRFEREGLISHSECHKHTKHLIGQSDFLLRFPLQYREMLCELLPLDKVWNAKDAFIAGVAGGAFDRSHIQLCQIQNYDFVDEDIIENASEWLISMQACEPTNFEVLLQLYFIEPVNVASLPPFEGVFGFCDAIHESETSTVLFEYKYITEIDDNAKLQLLMYMHMYVLQNVDRPQKMIGYVMNARAHHVMSYEMTPNQETSREFIADIFFKVYNTRCKL